MQKQSENNEEDINWNSRIYYSKYFTDNSKKLTLHDKNTYISGAVGLLFYQAKKL